MGNFINILTIYKTIDVPVNPYIHEMYFIISVFYVFRVFDALFHMDFLPSIPQDILIELLQRMHSKENTLPVDLSEIEEILKNYVPLTKRIGEEGLFSSTITKCILLFALLASTSISSKTYSFQ